jgi:ubiquitin-protein ligase E3 C
MTSGAEIPIDFNDLERHTLLDGYTSDDKPIQAFWRILNEFDQEHRRLFLRFVTSCSRPPLLGFQELYPRFCIRNAGNDDERVRLKIIVRGLIY